MCNVIKAYSVRYDNEDKITINNHLKFDKKLESEQKIIPKEAQPQDGAFVEGLKAVVVEELPSAQENTQKAEKIIEDARNEAESILQEAKEEAEKIKDDTFRSAQKKGYDEGSLQAKREAQKLKAEYEEKGRKLQKEYDDLTQSFEPQMAGIIADLVEKITGILVKNNEEVILYLINKAMKNLDKSESYTIRVSKEDYEYVSARRNILTESAGREVVLNISEDDSLDKNQCYIETDQRVINCGLDTQLNNLISDLKLLGGI